MSSASSANENQEPPVVAFVAALCDWEAWYNARRGRQVPGSEKEKDHTDVAGAVLGQ
jgi:hypothetical protein